MAEDNKSMQTASQALFEFTADQLIQQKYREEYNRVLRTNERDRKRLEEALAAEKRNKALAEKKEAQEENAYLRALLEEHNIKI